MKNNVVDIDVMRYERLEEEEDSNEGSELGRGEQESFYSALSPVTPAYVKISGHHSPRFTQGLSL